MVGYEEIYKHLCDRYSAEDVYHFFRIHENKVRQRIAQTVLNGEPLDPELGIPSGE